MFCPLASVELAGLDGGSGISWWQTAGGLAAVFGLLLLCLRLLGRFQKSRGADRASVLTVWPLGPKREIQVLRLGEDVHYVYRHDGAMVVLDRETLTAWEASRAAAPTAAVPGGPRGVLGMSALRSLVGRGTPAETVVRTPAG